MNLQNKSRMKYDMFSSGNTRHNDYLRGIKQRHPNRTRSQSKRTKTSESLNDEQSEMFSHMESMYSNVTEFQDLKFSNLGTPLKETFETPIKIVQNDEQPNLTTTDKTPEFVQQMDTSPAKISEFNQEPS